MNSYCNNCGKNGHAFHQCKSPITSYGILAFRENPTNSTREYLLIRRKDTLGFVDFMRGKYSIYNKEYILNMINQMTNSERTRLITDPFSKLWAELWGTDAIGGERMSVVVGPSNGEVMDDASPYWMSRSERIVPNPVDSPTKQENRSIPTLSLLPSGVPRSCFSEGIDQFRKKNEFVDRFCPLDVPSLANNNRDRSDLYKTEEQISRNKFESLKSGVYTKNDFYNLDGLTRTPDQQWVEPEWGFPKGRRNYQEKDYDCAVREFCEETGYNMDKLLPLKNIQPFEEIFTGSNYKSYKHKYYVTYMRYEETLSSRSLQTSEVSESKWMPFDECYAAIRHYNVEKKRLLAAVDKMLSENCLSHMNNVH